MPISFAIYPVSLAKTASRDSAFTLIELAIVLVIIGLVVGGVTVGRDLIAAAETRAVITQIEKYQVAVNTFKSKYNELPGDISSGSAAQFGFAARGPYGGQGDGNGILEGNSNNTPTTHYGWVQATGETAMFWVDLSAAQLIEGRSSAATSVGFPSGSVQGSIIDQYLPAAKIGHGNYIYAWSYPGQNIGTLTLPITANYFSLSNLSVIGTVNFCTWCIASTPGLTVRQAYDIDKKVDDALPQSGRVLAAYLNATIGSVSGGIWAGGPVAAGASSSGTPTTAATSGSPSTCYDNGGNAGAAQQYSLLQNNGSGTNCAVTFQFQ